MKLTVLVTGATGLLGRSVAAELESDEELEAVKCSFSRPRDGYIRMNLLDENEVSEVIQKHKPGVIVHCAAERFPNKVEDDLDAAKRLNVAASERLAVEAAKIGAYILYISTDYVFDGENPPYSEDSKPNPINNYGETKLLGEEAVMQVSPDNIVLRIPVLYGPVENLDESAVTTLLKNVLKSEQQSISDIEVRYPAHTQDIAHIIHQLIKRKAEGSEKVSGIYHWSGREALTKYQMVKIIGEAFNLNTAHISPNRDETQTTSGPKRPRDSRLTTGRLDELGISKHTQFSEGIRGVLERFVN